MKSMAVSASSSSMLAFCSIVLVVRRAVQVTASKRPLYSLSDAPPPSLMESFRLCPEDVESLRSQYMSKSCSVSYKNSGPLHISHGYKSRLVDVNGIEYLDTRNNVSHVGHEHPEVVHAITHQAKLLQTNTRYLHPHASLLAKKLSDMLPGSLEKVFFVNSGSEANDLALRLARAYRMQQQSRHDGSTHDESTDCIIAINHAYHGHTLSVLDVSPYKHLQGKEIVKCPAHVKLVPCPDVYRGIHSVNYNSDGRSQHSNGKQYCNSELEAADQYASYVELECKQNPISAFIVEGGMSVAGVILPPQSYLRQCIDAVHGAGGLYIADEVQTGFGRLGKCMWAFQHSNEEDKEYNPIIPDIVTVGKPFGNGQPLAAVVTTPSVASAFETLDVEYFNTFAGSPVQCAAGLAMLHVLTSEGLQENANDVGNYMLDLFRELQSQCEWIGDVRGSGLFLGVELVRDRHTLEPATEETSFVCSTLKDKYKILTSVDGAHDNVIVIKPPMVFSKDDADLFVSCFEKALLVDLPTVKDQVKNFDRTPT